MTSYKAKLKNSDDKHLLVLDYFNWECITQMLPMRTLL